MLHHWGSEGEFNIGGFILLTFIEPVRLALNELEQYKTAYVELTFACPMLQHFLLIIVNVKSYSSCTLLGIYCYIHTYVACEAG